MEEFRKYKLEKFDIKKIYLCDIWIGERYEIDDDFFQDYDSIVYSKNQKTVLFIKIEYPGGYFYYHDILGNIDAPIGTCNMNDWIAKYQIYPQRKLSNLKKQKISVNSIYELISLLPDDLLESFGLESNSMSDVPKRKKKRNVSKSK